MVVRSRIIIAVAALSALLPVECAFGALFTATGTNGATGSTLAASADFTVNGSGQLVITLTNTGDAAMAPSDVLTALFFNLNVAGVLTPVSAEVGSGSSIVNFSGTPDATNELGGEWQYLAGTGPGGNKQGISSSGLSDWFSSANFNNDELFTPPPNLNLDGAEGGIVNGINSSGNLGTTPLISNSVVFILSNPNLVANMDLTGLITNVSFQYGTAQDEPNIEPPDEAPLLPEPTSIVAWLLSAGGLGLILRRRRNKAAA